MDVEVDDDNPGDQKKNEEIKRISRVWEMKRKSLKQAMYYHLILKELNERNMVETKGLGNDAKKIHRAKILGNAMYILSNAISMKTNIVSISSRKTIENM